MTYKILTVDGGGFRGVIPAKICQHIEAETGQRMWRMFDLFAGTSTGAILTAGLVADRDFDAPPMNRPPAGTMVRPRRPAPQHTLNQILRTYRRLGPVIFADPPLAEVMETFEADNMRQVLRDIPRVANPANWANPIGIARNIPRVRRLAEVVESIGRLMNPLHDVAVLERELRGQFENRQMRHVLKPLLLTAYDLNSRLPVVFDSRVDRRRQLHRCAAASASAPTFFAPVNMRRGGGGNLQLTDGGVSMSNPALEAVSNAVRNGIPLEDITVISIGTGHATTTPIGARSQDWGPLQWLVSTELLSVMFDAMSDSVDQQLTAMLGPDRYHRLQLQMPPEDVRLDDGSRDYFNYLTAVSDAYIGSPDGRRAIGDALEAIA